MTERLLEDFVIEKVDYEDKVQRLFSILSPKQASALLLIAQGLTYEEVAKEFGVTVSAIGGRMEDVYEKAKIVFGKDVAEGRQKTGWHPVGIGERKEEWLGEL